MLRRVRDEALALALFLVTACSLVELYLALEWAETAAVVALLAFVLLAQHLFGLRERLLLLAGLLIAGALVWVDPAPWTVILSGLERAAYLTAFMVAIGVLKDAAMTSRDVQASGKHLTRQPPGLRYAALSTGAHFMAVLLNIGTLSMLAPLVLSGVRSGREAGEPAWISDIKLRRQLCATLRGFAITITWTPTTVTQAVLLSVTPSADLSRIIPYGLGFSALALLAGWVDDRVQWRWAARRAQQERGGAPRPRTDGAAPLGALLRFVMVCLTLIGASVIIHLAAGVSMVGALMLAAPFLTVGWIFAQNATTDLAAAPAETGRRVIEILRRSVPAASPEAFTLAIAGFIGAVLGALAPPELINAAFGPETIGPTALLLAAPAVIVLANQAAITPMISAVFLGSAINSLDPVPVDPNLLMLALAAGWGLCLTAAPFSAGPLVLGRVTGIPTTTLTWRWNGRYSLIAYGVLAAWLLFLRYAVVGHP